MLVAGVVLIGMGIAAGPPVLQPMRPSMQNLKKIGQAGAMYRADNKGYYPVTLTYSRGIAPQPGVTLEGWATWSFGGKNCDAYWADRAFDIEAADRPLNAYAVPGVEFPAPPIPTRMPADYPARTRSIAEVFHDPMDKTSRQRNWPAADPGISGYNDVGTSYQWVADWWNQLPNLAFVQRFNECTRRLASGQGVDPARFVWVSDEDMPAATYNRRRDAHIVDDYGNINTSQMLYVDGHAGYNRTFPGFRQISFDNPSYTSIFSDLPNPGFPE